MSSTVLEDVARIIDPEPWAQVDRWYVHGERVNVDRSIVKPSVDKARAILSLIPTRDGAALPEAYTPDEREVLADLREQLSDCMDDHAEWLRENETVHEADAPPEIEINAHALKWLLDIAEAAPPPPPVGGQAGDVEQENTLEELGCDHCRSGDKIPVGADYWKCPRCDAEWWPGDPAPTDGEGGR